MKLNGFFHRIFIFLLILPAGLDWHSAAITGASAATASSVLYVKPGASGTCASWATACELQTALGLAVTGDQVWVAAGTYKPTASTNRTLSFQLKGGVAVYGGFPAGGGDWSTRSWKTNLTRLSGDIGSSGLISDNSYHVVLADGVDATAILDGFTISGGNANGSSSSYYDCGGGMAISNASPSLKNILFTENSGVYGAGLYVYNGSPFLMDVTFDLNSSTYAGGGMVNYLCSPTLKNVTFSANSATDYGGGLDNYGSSPSLTNVTFSGNSAPTGGGLFNTEDSNPSLVNTTFKGNTATYGGAIYNWFSDPTVVNSILWANTSDQIANGGDSAPVVTYSDIQGGYSGTGNINQDPLLAALANNGGQTQTHALLTGSPAIDAGNPSTCPLTDQRGYFRPIDGNGDMVARCDMGAYEYNSSLALFIYLPLTMR